MWKGKGKLSGAVASSFYPVLAYISASFKDLKLEGSPPEPFSARFSLTLKSWGEAKELDYFSHSVSPT